MWQVWFSRCWSGEKRWGFLDGSGEVEIMRNGMREEEVSVNSDILGSVTVDHNYTNTTYSFLFLFGSRCLGCSASITNMILLAWPLLREPCHFHQSEGPHLPCQTFEIQQSGLLSYGCVLYNVSCCIFPLRFSLVSHDQHHIPWGGRQVPLWALWGPEGLHGKSYWVSSECEYTILLLLAWWTFKWFQIFGILCRYCRKVWLSVFRLWV